MPYLRVMDRVCTNHRATGKMIWVTNLLLRYSCHWMEITFSALLCYIILVFILWRTVKASFIRILIRQLNSIASFFLKALLCITFASPDKIFLGFLVIIVVQNHFTGKIDSNLFSYFFNIIYLNIYKMQICQSSKKWNSLVRWPLIVAFGTMSCQVSLVSSHVYGMNLPLDSCEAMIQKQQSTALRFVSCFSSSSVNNKCQMCNNWGNSC